MSLIANQWKTNPGEMMAGNFCGNMYVCKTESLWDCVNHCVGNSPVTWAIPDLQRDFVWNPEDVLLLVDTIFRGWPFGTLTLLSMAGERELFIDFRSLIRVKNERGDSALFQCKTDFTSDDPLLLILDGQQRMQALSLAFGCDDAGFVYNERQWMHFFGVWHQKIYNRDFVDCPVGSLYLDIEELEQAFSNANRNITAIKFMDEHVVVWGISDLKFQSPYYDNNSGPLDRVLHRKVGRRGEETLVRLSRIWRWVSEIDVQNLSDDTLRNKLGAWDISPVTIEKSLDAFRAFVKRTKELQKTEISRLEINLADPNLSHDEFSRIIVDIFTRLNKAGTPLRLEEITFAWLKRGWDRGRAGNSAKDCFDDLMQKCKEYGQPFSTSNLIVIASVVWAAIGKGQIIRNDDLLKSEPLLKLTKWLSENWILFSSTCVDVAKAIQKSQLEFQQNYHSVLIFALWLVIQMELKVLMSRLSSFQDRALFLGQVQDPISNIAQRFFICSQWTGYWSSEKIVSVGTLLEGAMPASPISAGCKIKAQVQDVLTKIVSLADDAVEGLSADNRQQVVRYRPYLWVWHRLDKARMEKWSQFCNRTPHVDHSVAFALWLKLLGKQKNTLTVAEQEKFVKIINSLGNCILLNADYNIAKSDHAFSEFFSWLSDAYGALGLSPEMTSPEDYINSGGTPDKIEAAIIARETSIKKELKAFIHGEKCLLQI